MLINPQFVLEHFLLIFDFVIMDDLIQSFDFRLEILDFLAQLCNHVCDNFDMFLGRGRLGSKSDLIRRKPFP